MRQDILGHRAHLEEVLINTRYRYKMDATTTY